MQLVTSPPAPTGGLGHQQRPVSAGGAARGASHFGRQAPGVPPLGFTSPLDLSSAATCPGEDCFMQNRPLDWLFISFAAKHKGTTSPHSYKTTTVGDADGQALCGEPCPAPTPFLRLWERGATAPRLPPASLSPTPGSRHSPSGLLQNTPCTLLGENRAVWRGGALRPAPRGALFGSVVNWRR